MVNSQLEGVHIVTPQKATPKIATAMAKEFEKKKRMRTRDGQKFLPLVESGDKSHGVRRLYILSGRNPIKERVLVELGNFSNPTDHFRIRNPDVREEFADIMANALKSLLQ